MKRGIRGAAEAACRSMISRTVPRVRSMGVCWALVRTDRTAGATPRRLSRGRAWCEQTARTAFEWVLSASRSEEIVVRRGHRGPAQPHWIINLGRQRPTVFSHPRSRALRPVHALPGVSLPPQQKAPRRKDSSAILLRRAIYSPPFQRPREISYMAMSSHQPSRRHQGRDHCCFLR